MSIVIAGANAQRLSGGDLSARLGEPLRWGDGYWIETPGVGSFAVVYGFGNVYGSPNFSPLSKGQPLYTVLGPPLENERQDGGRSVQAFRDGWLTYSDAEGMRVQLKLKSNHTTEIPGGTIRRLPVGLSRDSDEHRQALVGDTATDWGEVYSCHNARLSRQFQVKRGFALIYEASHAFPETNRRPPCELLGAPASEEREEAKGHFVQDFERGRLTWSEEKGFGIELQAPGADRFSVQEPQRRTEVLLGAPRRIKDLDVGDLYALAGRPRPTPAKPRLRLAPSPSGLLHPGNLYMALKNVLLAKQLGAELLLRIEDTDAASSRPEYVEALKEDLRWAGVEWKDDEVELQSRRGETYRRAAEKLIASGHAERRDGAVYFKMPEAGTLVIEDRAKGRVSINLVDDEGMRDFVILRADGTATFLLANTVDDAEQKITHVVRGEGHLLNAARQICLYRALGAPVPEFFHLPHVLGDEGDAKLSKRNGDTSLRALRAAGIAPEVLVNHLARLGMKRALDDGKSIKTLDELATGFDRFGFSKSAARIGLLELLQRNKRFLQDLGLAELRQRMEAFDPELMGALERSRAIALVDGVRGRASTLAEAADIGRFIIAPPKYGEEAATQHNTPEARAAIGGLVQALEALPSWSLAELRTAIGDFNRSEGTRTGAYAAALTWMLTGVPEGLPIEHLLTVIGRSEALRRLHAILRGDLAVEPERLPGAAPGSPSTSAVGRAAPADLRGPFLKTYLSAARRLGAPLGPAVRGEDGVTYQRFARGLVNEHGQIRLIDAPAWVGAPFLVLDETNSERQPWVDGYGRPKATGAGLAPTGNNHFYQDLGMVGVEPGNVRGLSFKVFFTRPDAALLLQTYIGASWEHRWTFDGRASYQGGYPWPARGATNDVPVGQWIDVHLDLIHDLGGAPGQAFGGLALTSDDEAVRYSDVRVELTTPGILAETHQKYAEVLGGPVGEAAVSTTTGQWTQEFQEGWVRQDGHVMFRDHQFWLVNGKLDGWLKAPLALHAPKAEAYWSEANKQWQQDFEHGTTDDAGRVKLNGHDQWLFGRILDVYLAHPRELGSPVSPAAQGAEGAFEQRFQHGWIRSDGSWGKGDPGTPSAASALPERLQVARGQGLASAAFPDGTLIRQAGQVPVYVVRAGARFHIPNPDVFQRMGFQAPQIRDIDQATMDCVPDLPPEGTLLREANRPEVYELCAGKRCHISTIEKLRARHPQPEVHVVPDDSLAGIPIGEVI